MMRWGCFMPLMNLAYDPMKTVTYAAQWAMGRNPAYMNFHGMGGDCTNFCSQCVYRGAGVMNPARGTGWYYYNANNRSPSWTAVRYFYQFLIGNRGPGPYARQVSMQEIMLGDIIQLGTAEGEFYHSLVVTSLGEPKTPDNILISTHTFDAYLRPLGTYYYENIRFLHIDGVRKWV
jgi:hypothetical protein